MRRKQTIFNNKREATGEGSIYSQMQPFDGLDIKTLLDKRIDHLFTLNKETATEELCWCQGKAVEVNKNPHETKQGEYVLGPNTR